MASTYLTRSNGTPTSQQIFTFSAWVKRSGLNPSGNNMELFSQYNDTSNRMDFRFQTGDTIDFYHTSSLGRITTNRLFRDTSAWYHIVLRVDTTQATSSDRYRLYINGVQETSFSTATYPSQNANLGTNFSTFSIGDDSYGSGDFDGCMTHIHYTDGQSYDATAFGETDATTGEWKIKTSPSVTYGTNGFFILKDGNSVTDQSGNGNNFTVAGGTLTNTEDNPSNVFATLNTLTLSASQLNIINGNTSKSNTPTSNAWRSIVSTLGASTGKYYFEVRVDNREEIDLNNFVVGITDYEQSDDQTATNGKFFAFSRGYGYHAKNGDKLNNDSVTANGVAYGSSWTTNDIIGCAFDLDNGKIYFSKNGVWQNSGDPTSGATGTGSAFDIATGYTYFPVMAQYYGNEHYSFNFGNGVFGNGTVASAGTNASGNGIFEYDVPTGYTALCTKGLNGE